MEPANNPLSVKRPLSLVRCFERHDALLLEGALGERLKREYALTPDPHVALAAFARSEAGRRALCELWQGYRQTAARYGLPFLATTPTRRANRERTRQAGEDAGLLRDCMALLAGLKTRRERTPVYTGGLMGCKGDAYTGEGALDEEDARRFHAWQADILADAGADFLYAGIMPTLPEALGMARALAATGLPYIISFTLLDRGTLVDATPLHTAIRHIDSRTERPPLCYMTNCVHPDIVRKALLQPVNRTELVRQRFQGIQANAAPLEYAVMDNATSLLTSAPDDLAHGMLGLRELTAMKIFGGCCGTDDRHLEAIARWLSPRRSATPDSGTGA